MNIDLLTLQSFLEVAATGSFTKAAEKLGRTQSAISQQIAKLESVLTKKLFTRGKTFALTEEGEIYVNYARKIVDLHLESLDRFKEPELQGEVRFGVPEDFATVYLADVLTDFIRLHPRILLNVECDLTLNLFERFKKLEFDLVLVKMNRPEDFPHGQNVWSEKLEWVGSKNFKNVQTDGAHALPLILSPQPCVYRSRAINALEDANIRWKIVYSSPSYTGTIAAVKAGLGITVLPKTMVPKDLQILEWNFLPHLSDTHISLLKYNGDNPVIKSFENFVLKKIKH